VYRVVQQGGGFKQAVKNLIFASIGPKPELVLSNAVTNEIRIVKNEEFILVFDQEIPEAGLKWEDLVSWWATREKIPNDQKAKHSLYQRLLSSLSSPLEKVLFQTYCAISGPLLQDELPALIPQVYLHYDPYTVTRLGGTTRLSRQRMDFLILFSHNECVIIEVDGKQHYADDDGKANPSKYAAMVAEDRSLRLAGYELYRFGGFELQQSENGKKLIEEFFFKLFKKHGV
jgi:hypothetical protein